jgi:hypothetical protein
MCIKLNLMPDGQLFFENGARIFPQFLDMMLLNDATTASVESLKPMCIYMHVGGRDSDWHEAMEQQSEMFKQNGYTVQFRVEDNQDHVLNLGPEGVTRLYDHLDAAAKGCSK